MENEELNVIRDDCVNLRNKVAELEQLIQESKKSDSKIEDYASLYLALVEQASDALFVHDYDGRLIEVNQQACDILGYSKQELLNMSVTDIEQDFNLEQARNEWDKIKHGERFSLLGRHRRKDGSILPVDIRFGSAVWKGDRIFLVLVRDRTEKLEAEENIRKEKERLEEAEKFAGMGSWESYLITGSGWWSPNLYNIFHLDPADGFPTVESYINAVHPDDRHLIRGVFEKISKGELPEANEYRTNPEYGDMRCLSPTVNIHRDKNGNPVRYFGSILDVTQRKKSEEALEALNKKLEERVKERTSELESANRELEAFSYTVSHDLRSPLRKINNYSLFLISDHAEALNDEGKWFLEKIRKDAASMDRLITDLLNLSHLSKTEIVLEEVKMTMMVKSVYNEVATEEEKEAFEFLLEPLPSVSCDPALIKQVWQNLIGNALKYSSKSATKRIMIFAKEEVNEVVYCIKDYGAGFDVKYKAKLFTAFQRLHTAEEFPGTGVGLAIVDRIINLHGGKVRAESGDGNGATFCFSLLK